MSRMEELQGCLKEQAIDMFGVIANVTGISEKARRTLLDGVSVLENNDTYSEDHPAFAVVRAYKAERRERFITNGTLRI